jgi:nitronate monooxygenase
MPSARAAPRQGGSKGVVMAFTTRVTTMLGIEHPIIQGGMQNVGYAELAAAVSNAGGLGMLTALTQPGPAELRAEIERCRAMTDKPFGVNMTVLPTINPPDYAGLTRAIIDSGVKIVETAGGKQVREIWDMLKPHGVLILHKCTSVRHALSAERNGCDGLIAALALGADAINMGTRFCATQEAPIHPAVKQTYLDHDERGTNLIFRQFHNTARVSKTEVSDEVVRIGSRPGATFEEVKHLVSGAQGAKLLRDGDLSLGVYWAGMVQGLIHDIPTVKELIDRIIAEAEGIVRERLAGMLG